MKCIIVRDGEKAVLTKVTNIVGDTVRVYLKEHATDYEAFPLRITAASEIKDVWYIEGYDLERMDLRIELKDIDYVMKGSKTI